MSFELGRALLLMEAITPAALGQALLVAARDGVSLVRAVANLGGEPRARIELELSRTLAPNEQPLVPARELMDRLPDGLCARMLAIPLRRDPRTGTIDVAVADSRDGHGAAEIGHHLAAEVRVVQASIGALERALAEVPFVHRLEAPETPSWTGPPTPPSPTLLDEVAIPLLRKSIRPGGPVSRRPAPALVFDEEERERTPAYASPAPPGSPLAGAAAAPSLAAPTPAAGSSATGPSTLIPPPSTSVPPPPNTEPRPPLEVEPPESFETFEPPMRRFDGETILLRMRAAPDRDALFGLLTLGAKNVARRIALFALRRDELVGWSCTPSFGDAAAVRGITIPVKFPSALSIAITNGHYLGPLYKSEAHDPILEVMGSASRDVAAYPVKVKGRATLVILADELGDTMLATRRLEELASVAGEALTRILREQGVT